MEFSNQDKERNEFLSSTARRSKQLLNIRMKKTRESLLVNECGKPLSLLLQ
jgi:hypothetical protein